MPFQEISIPSHAASRLLQRPLHHRDGALPPNHAIALLYFAVMHAPRQVFEIGTFFGHTTLLLAQNLPGAIIHTIDLPEDFDALADQPLDKSDPHLIGSRQVGNEYLDKPESGMIVQYYGDTATWDFSPVKDCTFFFIDGSHTYEYAKNDTQKCFDACEGKATFVWHDCDQQHPGVMRFLQEWQTCYDPVFRIMGTSLAYSPCAF